MDRRRTLLAAFAFASAVLAAAPALAFFGTTISPSGKVVTESREARGYTGISVSLPGMVVVRQGENAPVAIEADDNLMPEIETVVERGTLRIRFKRNVNVSGRATIRLLVTNPAIDALSVAGSGDILAESIKGRSLEVSVAGSGDVRVARIEADSLKASVAGSGDVKVAGKAADVSVNVAGSGDVEADRLESRRAKVKIAGSGDVKLWVAESLDVSVAGSGDVRYYGDPAVSKSVMGSGSIRRLGAAP